MLGYDGFVNFPTETIPMTRYHRVREVFTVGIITVGHRLRHMQSIQPESGYNKRILNFEHLYGIFIRYRCCLRYVYCSWWIKQNSFCKRLAISVKTMYNDNSTENKNAGCRTCVQQPSQISVG